MSVTVQLGRDCLPLTELEQRELIRRAIERAGVIKLGPRLRHAMACARLRRVSEQSVRAENAIIDRREAEYGPLWYLKPAWYLKPGE